jgi:hypothetical protein
VCTVYLQIGLQYDKTSHYDDNFKYLDEWNPSLSYPFEPQINWVHLNFLYSILVPDLRLYRTQVKTCKSRNTGPERHGLNVCVNSQEEKVMLQPNHPTCGYFIACKLRTVSACKDSKFTKYVCVCVWRAGIVLHQGAMQWADGKGEGKGDDIGIGWKASVQVVATFWILQGYGIQTDNAALRPM